MKKRLATFVLGLSGTILSAAAGAAEPRVSVRDYNAAREHGYKLFIQYRKEFGVDMRMSAMLKACDYTQLANDLQAKYSNPRDFAAKQFGTSTEAPNYDAPKTEMLWYVLLVTQSLAEAYEIGYAEAMKGELQRSNSCSAVPQVYEKRLREKRQLGN